MRRPNQETPKGPDHGEENHPHRPRPWAGRGPVAAGRLHAAAAADAGTAGAERSPAAGTAVQGKDRPHDQGIHEGLPQGSHRPEGRAECPAHPHRRRGLWRIVHVRRADSDAHDGSAGEGRVALHAVPHHGAVLTHARGAAHRAQSPQRRDGCHHGARHRLPRLQQPSAEERRDVRRDPQAERLQHRLVRQEPQRARLAHEPGGAVRPLADGAGLRVLLRIHRRRHEPVGPGALRRHQAHRAAARREGLFLRQGHGRPRHRPHPHAARRRPAEAVAAVLRAGHGPRAASRAEGVDREVQGQVRPGLGQAA